MRQHRDLGARSLQAQESQAEVFDMRPFDIYKIGEKLSEFETSIGVIRIEPVWGKEMSAQEYFLHMISRVERARRLLLPGELGCALAHMNIYKQISASQRPSLILEDDIELTKDTLGCVENVVGTLRQPDFINFSIYSHPFKRAKVADGIYVADTSSGFWGTAAYFVTPAMASRIEAHHTIFIDLADNWQELFVGCSAIPYYAPIFQHSGGRKSTIGDRAALPQNASLPHAIKLRILRRRMTALARLRYANHLLRARRHARAIRNARGTN